MRGLGWRRLAPFSLLASIGLFAGAAWGQATNDAFASATVITGGWGSIGGCNTNATREPNEPSHAGFAPVHSIWYQWTAPANGEVSMDTFGSHCLETSITRYQTNVIIITGTNIYMTNYMVTVTNIYPGPLDTILAVYTGSDVAHLTQIAANDDVSPYLLQKEQYWYTQPIQNSGGEVDLPFGGPSGLRFNAVSNTTYYIAIDSKSSSSANSSGAGNIFGNSTISAPDGFPQLNWAYHSSGVFRFASEDFNWANPTGPVPMYYCTPYESNGEPDGKTYYTYTPKGLLVTVTRLAGSAGRALVDYATVDGTATNGIDYTAVAGTLVFDDFEMSKDIIIPILGGSYTGMAENPATAILGGPPPAQGVDFSILLSNPQLDPIESADVSAPRLDQSWYTATVRILNYDLVMDGSTNRDVYNFSRVHYRFPEDADTYYASCSVEVIRTAAQSSPPESATLHCHINSVFLGGGDSDNFFPLEPGCDYATPDPAYFAGDIHGTNSDFTLLVNGVPTSGAADVDITIPPGPLGTGATISFTINDDGLTKFARNFRVSIDRDPPQSGPVVPVGTANECTVTILFNDQHPPAGSVDELHNPDHSYDMKLPAVPFSDPDDMDKPGADGQVMGIAMLPSMSVVTVIQGTNTVLVTNVYDQTLIVGGFHSYNSFVRNGIARINVDGSLDQSFLAPPLDGANDFISCIALAPNGEIFIGGNFSSFNGQQINRVALLHAIDGSPDQANFNPGSGANGTVRAAVALPNGGFLIGGDFTSYNGVNCSHVALLKANGQLDTSFVAAAITGTTVNAVAAYNGKYYIGGDFTAVGGRLLSDLARLNGDGSLDVAYANNLGVGADGKVYALAIDGNGNLLAGGVFLNAASIPRVSLARFLSSGKLDTSFDPGTGADNAVFVILPPQADGTIYAAGMFTSFNGTHRLGLTRLFANGTVDTSFLDPAYNQFAGLHRRRYIDPAVAIYAAGIQSDGNVMIGGSFEQVGGGQANAFTRIDPNDLFGPYNQDVYTEPKVRTGLRNRWNFARLIGGATPGPGNLSLTYTNFSTVRSASSATLSLTRTNGSLGYLSANLSVPSGVAQSGLDYSFSSSVPTFLTAWRLYDYLPATPPGALTRCFSDGLFGVSSSPTDIYGSTFFSYPAARMVVGVLPDSSPGDRQASIRLSNPSCADQFYLGGETIPIAGALGSALASFTIVDDNHNPGVFGFASPTFTVNENAGFATVNVARTNGSYGNVALHYLTTSTGSAASGQDYIPTNGTLNFFAGVTNLPIYVPIVNNILIQPKDRTVGLNLNLLSAGTWGLTNALLYIIDDDYPIGYVNFNSATYATNESSGAVSLTVNRTGGTRGTISVLCATTNSGTAQPGVNYTSVSTNLVWNDGDSSPRVITIPLLDNGLVGPDTTFQVLLLNSVAYGTNAPTILGGSRTTAAVTIHNDNAYGNLEFSAPTYTVDEAGGYATITVIRPGGAAQTLTVNFATADGTAYSSGPLQYRNFGATNGTLTFGPGQLSASFTVPIFNDYVVDPLSFFFTVSLSNLTPAGAALGSPTTAVVNILDAQTFNAPAGSLDPAFNPYPGFNGDVYSVALQPNGQILVGGNFTTANGASRNGLARLNADASLDTTFEAGLSGANGAVNALLVESQADVRIVAAGAFTTLNAVNRGGIVRLLADGTLDSSFNPGSGANDVIFSVVQTLIPGTTNGMLVVGGRFNLFNGLPHTGLVRLLDSGIVDATFTPSISAGSSVYAIATYPTNSIYSGQILIAGDFTTVDGVSRNGIARLNADGSLDVRFDPGAGATNAVRALAIQLDGRILVGGSFTNFNGTFTNLNGSSLNYLTRLNSDGTLDPAFNVGLGANDTVNSILLQPDTRIVVVGDFTRASGVTRGHITRLLPDGTVDPTINFGLGTDSYIDAVALQPTNGMLIIGGGFSQYDGQPRERLARIYGGAMSDSGALTFAAAEFQADENSTNALITVRRTGGTAGDVAIDFFTSPGTAVAGGVNFSNVAATLNFPQGETFQSIIVPVFQDFQITPDLTVNLFLTNPVAPAVLGDQLIATLLILNDDSAVSFSSGSYSVNQNVATTVAAMELTRQGSTRFPASLDFYTTTNGTAIAGVDYQAVSNTVTFATGQTNLQVTVPILNNPAALNDVTVGLQLTNASNTLLFNPSSATLTIFSTNTSPGQLYFAQTNYIVGEADGAVALTVLRTNGHSGQATVNFATVSGTNADSAVPGVKYTPTNGILAFADGELSKTIYVTILQTNLITGNVSFSVLLSSPSRGTQVLPPTSANVTILDENQGVGFHNGIYITNETAGAVILQVDRILTNGQTTVQYATVDGTATNGVNYRATSGTLTFIPGEASKSLSIPVLHDPRVTGSLTFEVNLTNQSAPAVLYPYASALINLLDADAGISFTNALFGVFKSGTNVLISVTRSNANTGLVSVNFATSDNTATANLDYYPTNGVLIFSNGVALQSFTVPIINNRQLEGDRSFNVLLSTNATSLGSPQLLAPYAASVIITDNIAGLSFSSPAYQVLENGQQAIISVLRTGFTNCSVQVDFTALAGTNSGSAVAGVNYTPTNGTLLFTNTETLKSFAVPVRDDSRVDGDHTVQLSLANPRTTNSPVGFAVLTTSNAATLTILEADGSDVISAGAALTFTLSFTNPAPISLATATGAGLLFPSVIGVSNIASQVEKVAVRIPAISIPAAQDLGVLLTGPAGASTLLMANAGGAYPLAGTSVAFDDGATNTLPQTSAITNGAYSPAAYALPPFPAAPLPPYGTNLEAFVDSTPNGNWSLYVLNDTSPFGGSVPNGWAVDLTCLETNANRLIHPGETVSMLFAFCVGAGFNVNHLVATLLPTNGVTNPSGPQTYGPLADKGPSVSRLFTFTPMGTNGQLIAATFQLQDGANLLNSVVFNFVLGTSTTTYSNPAPIYINDFTTATPYPSTILVGGVGNVVTKTTVTLTNLAHTWPSDIDILLVSPAGQKSYLMSKCGGSDTITNVTLVFDDAATTSLLPGVQIANGSYRPSAWALATPPFPPTTTPPPPYVTNLTTFNGNNPNGVWGLYVIDDTLRNSGIISNGWLLNLTTATPVPPAADLGLAMSASADTVSLTSNLSFTVSLINYGPAAASNVVVSNTLPSGAAFVSASPSQGQFSTNGAGQLTWNAGSLLKGAQASLLLTVQPGLLGLAVNSATVSAVTTDLNPNDNSATASATVVAPKADLALGLVSTPNSLPLGNTYSLTATVTNLGPDSASQLVIVFYLDPTAAFVSSPQAGWILDNLNNIVTFTNLGNPGSNSIVAATNVSVVVRPSLPSINTSYATCYSGDPSVTDPFKSNNDGLVKTVVLGPLILQAQASAANGLVLTWPTNLGFYNVQFATNLTAPVLWFTVTNPPPAIVNGLYSFTNAIGPDTKFFRLHGATP